MTEEAYNELLRGDGYHMLRGLISPEEAAAVRELTLSRLHEGRRPERPNRHSRHSALGTGYS
jgi:hypothetical protein